MRSVSLVIFFTVAGLSGGVTYAAETADALAAALARPSASAPSIAPTYVAGFGQTADARALEKLSGGSDVSNDMTLHGNVSNNSTDNTTTGFNSIASGSFSGAVGLPMVIQNSGNGVLIQNATIISVQFQP